MCDNYTDFLAELEKIHADLGEIKPVAKPRRTFADITAEITDRMAGRGLDGLGFAKFVAHALCNAESKGIWLVGNVGSGKTERAKFLCEILNCRFYTAQEIADTYGHEEAWAQLFKGWNSIYPCANDIIVDDLGTESPTVNIFGKTVDPIALFIQERYRRKMRVHYTTNLNASEIQKRYGARVHSRLLETVVPFVLVGKDRRKNSK